MDGWLALWFPRPWLVVIVLVSTSLTATLATPCIVETKGLAFASQILKTVRSYVNTVPPMPLNTLAANAVQDTFTTSIPIHASSTPSTNLIASQSNSSVPVTTASSVQTEWSSVLPGMAAVLAVWSLTVPSAKPTTIPFVQNAISGFTLVLVKLPVSDALSTTAPNAPLPNV